MPKTVAALPTEAFLGEADVTPREAVVIDLDDIARRRELLWEPVACR